MRVSGGDLDEVEAPTEPAGETILTYFKPDDAVLRKLDRKDLKILIREQYVISFREKKCSTTNGCEHNRFREKSIE